MMVRVLICIRSCSMCPAYVFVVSLAPSKWQQQTKRLEALSRGDDGGGWHRGVAHNSMAVFC
jgi:hypothetical protein